MRINKVGAETASKFGFKSLRTDKKAIAQLARGEKSIIDNNKLNILAALNNLSNQSDDDTINFLLYVADNIAYGQGINSEFKDVLNEDNITPENRENTNWLQLLDDTIKKSISGADEENKFEHIEEYIRIFTKKKALTPEQKTVLELRENLTNAVLNRTDIDDTDSLTLATNIRENLDYFTASSEIPIKIKSSCLKKLVMFLDDSQYKITPQLQDKKLKILDEILNDIVIKTPNDELKKTRTTDQRQSGMCAAISICRKAMAYEDKENFIDLIMNELNDSPTISVFDVTALGSGKKVDIPKTNINYNIAQEKGYRIIDAAAHNWMHNAHASGNGTIQTEHYIAFDEDNYGIFDDSSWYTYSSTDGPAALLRALIKEKEFISSFDKMKKTIKKTLSTVNEVKSEAIKSQSKAIGELNNIFSEIFRNRTTLQRTALIKSLINFYSKTNDNNEKNFAKQQKKEVKQNVLANYIINSVPDITEEEKTEINKKAVSILDYTEMYTQADKDITSLKRFSSPRNKYIYNKRLFNIAAAHRVVTERDVNLSDGPMLYEKYAGLPPRDIQITDYLKSLAETFGSYKERQKYADENGVVPTQEELENQLYSDILALETTIPKQLNDIAKTLYDKDVKETISTQLEIIKDAIKNGNKEALDHAKFKMNIGKDKQSILANLNKKQELLSQSIDKEKVMEIARLLGYEDLMHTHTANLYYFLQIVQGGISEKDFKRLSKIFGGEFNIAKGIELQVKKFEKTKEEYDTILAKWNVPTSRELILQRLEKRNEILSRNQLSDLRKHFTSIEAGMAHNESIHNTKERKKENDKLFVFSKKEEDLFKKIEKRLPYMRKHTISEYDNINKLMKNDLEEKYARIGMLNGQFWVREEGSSGLSANEQIRIIEQMTGKPYHMQTDVNDAVKEIKRGNGSGILSMSVDDSDYAFHAQYVPSVTTETFTTPDGEKETKEVIWTDNSWGDSEREYFWNGHDGFDYTDYGRGFGLKDGFILAKDNIIGLPVKNIHGAIGIVKNGNNEGKDDNEEFGLFSDVILPGTPINSYQKLYKMFNYVLNIDEGSKDFESLEKLLDGKRKINIKQLETYDDLAEAKLTRILERVNKEIKTEEDFNKLPENDELKMAFKQLAVYLSTDNPEFSQAVIGVMDDKELEEVKEAIFEEHVNIVLDILGKTNDVFNTVLASSYQSFEGLLDEIKTKFGTDFTPEQRKNLEMAIFAEDSSEDKYNGSIKQLENIYVNRIVNKAVDFFKTEEEAVFFIEKATAIITKAINDEVKINSLDSLIITKSPLYQQFINAIDKYLKPKSDEEMLQLIQELQLCDNKTAEGFIKNLQPEDVGLTIKSPYDYLLRYKANDYSLYRALSEIVQISDIYKNLYSLKNNAAENIYRNLYVELSDMDVQKYIKPFKAEAFQKYKVRQAFPNPVVMSDEDIRTTVSGMFNHIKKSVESINTTIGTINILKQYAILRDSFISNPEFINLCSSADTDLNRNENSDKMINDFLKCIGNLYNLAIQDSSFKEITNLIQDIISTFSDNESDKTSIIDKLNYMVNIFDGLENSSVTIPCFQEALHKELAELNYGLKLMVNCNIEPKYRNDAFQEIKSIVNMYRFGANEEDIQYAEEFFNNFVSKRHIVKNPTVLLKEIVKLLQDGKKDSDEYSVLKKYLLGALNVAQQTKIQYKLVQNQHEAISSKTKDILPYFNVHMQSTGKEEPMNSETGFLYIIKQLENPSDNHKTLNLFLEQSGLSQQALSAIIKNFELEKTNNIVDEKTKEIKEDLLKLDELASFIQNYLASNTIEYPDIKAAIEDMIAHTKQNFKDYDDIPVVKTFLYYLDSLEYKGKFEKSSARIIKQLTHNISLDALQYVTNSINATIDFIPEMMSNLDDQVSIVATITVPEGTDEFKEKEKFLNLYQQIKDYVNQCMLEIVDASNKCKCLSGESIIS